MTPKVTDLQDGEREQLRRDIRHRAWWFYAIVTTFFILFNLAAAYGIAYWLQGQMRDQINAYAYKQCRAAQAPHSVNRAFETKFQSDARVLRFKAQHDKPILRGVDHQAAILDARVAKGVVPKTCPKQILH